LLLSGIATLILFRENVAHKEREGTYHMAEKGWAATELWFSLILIPMSGWELVS